MSYAQLCKPSVKLLGTGVGKCPKDLGAVTKLFLATEDFTNTEANLKLKATWDTAILAETVIPLPEVVEIEPQNVEAGYQELPNGETRRNKKERRKTAYKFAENIITHSGIKSYSDQQWYIWEYTQDGYLVCHDKGADSYEGFKSADFIVDAYSTQTFDAIPQTTIRIEHDDVDDKDMEFGIIQPDFDMMLLNGAIQSDIVINSVVQDSGILTISISPKIKGEDKYLVGLLKSDFILKDINGNNITITSAFESPSGTYTIIAIDNGLSGTIELTISEIGSENYKGVQVNYIDLPLTAALAYQDRVNNLLGTIDKWSCVESDYRNNY